MSKRALSTGGKANESLKWDVFVAPGIPTAASDLPPDTKQGMWSPISSTLIYGKRIGNLTGNFHNIGRGDRSSIGETIHELLHAQRPLPRHQVNWQAALEQPAVRKSVWSLYFLPVILTCDNDMTRVKSVFDTV